VAEIFERYLNVVRAAWRGGLLDGARTASIRRGAHLVDRVWQATFSGERRRARRQGRGRG